MRFMRTSVLLLVAVLAAASVFAQGSRGSARLAGKIVDSAGKPIEGVEVRAVKVGETQVLTAKSNDKGEWVLNGLAGGDWNVDLIREGLETIQRAVRVIEGNRMPTMSMTMTKAVPKADPNAELQKEMARADELIQKQQFVEARKIYEGLLAKYPEVFQLNNFIARVYSAEGNNPKAIEHARASLARDPESIESKFLLAFLLQASGEKVESTKLLASIDVTQAKDPLLFVNVAINYINENKPQDAIDLLTKLVNQFPKNTELLYYRGRAHLAGSKWDEAKADLEKFVAANPPESAKEVEDAKKILSQMVKK